MKPIRFTVDAGPHARHDCPVRSELPIDTPPTGAVLLLDGTTRQPLPVQAEPLADGKLLVTFIADHLASRERRALELTESATRPATGVSLTLNEAAERVDIHVGGRPFTTYHFGRQYARPFLFPLNEPGGKCVTRAWPILEGAPGETNDHPHHKSCWTAWGDVNGVDHWSEMPGHGRQVHRKLLALADGPVCGVLHAANDWVDAAGRKQLEEDRRVTTYRLSDELRIADFQITFRMTEGAVRFGDTKEGGLLALRLATTMDADKGGALVNSYGGFGEVECWGKRAHWADYFGPVGGETCGIAIFDHPDNLRYPTYWHIRNYGLMTANPYGLSHFRGTGFDGSMSFAAGSCHTYRYRLLIHKGDAKAARVAEHFLNYVAPPTATAEPA